MSERMQRTAVSTRDKMLQRYGDEFHHKHDKNHIQFRRHCRSHPVERIYERPEGVRELNESTGLVGQKKLRQFSKSISVKSIH